MKSKLNPLLLAMMYGMGTSLFRNKPQEDELSQYFRIYNTTLEKEYNLIQQKKSGLSTRLRNEVIYMYEKTQEDKK